MHQGKQLLLLRLLCTISLVQLCTSQDCPAGQYRDLDWTPCKPCAAGEFQTVGQDGKNVCLDCPVNTFSTQDGATQCTPCPAGWHTYGSSGSIQCSACAASFVPDTEPGSFRCTACPDGQYTPTKGSSPCRECPAGGYILTEGADKHTCVQCPAGTAAPASVAEKCDSARVRSGYCCPACQPGTFTSQPGSTSCQVCPAGTYQSSSGGTSCLPCPAGSYAPTTGASACILADVGFYVDKPGQTQQQACPAGTVGLVRGGTSQNTTCVPFATGRFSFTDRQDRLVVSSNPGAYVVLQSLGGPDSTRVMDSGSATGCSGQVYVQETSYLCTSNPWTGTLDLVTCTAQPAASKQESGCVSYRFYALLNGTFAWVVNSKASCQPTACTLASGAQQVSCRFIEKVGAGYYEEVLHLGSVTPVGPDTATANTNTAARSSLAPVAAAAGSRPAACLATALLSVAAALLLVTV